MCLFKHDELMYKLHGMRRKSVILKGDIIAANGIIHVTDGVMDKPPNVIGSHKVSTRHCLPLHTLYMPTLNGTHMANW